MAVSYTDYSSPTSITCTLTSLANAGFRCSAYVSNTVNKYTEVFVQGAVKVNSSISVMGSITIYAYASVDGTNFTAGVPGTDSTVTGGSGVVPLTFQRILYPIVSVVVNSTDDGDLFQWGPVALTTIFGGSIPPYWGVVVYNSTGNTFDATGTGNFLKYVGIKYGTS